MDAKQVLRELASSIFVDNGLIYRPRKLRFVLEKVTRDSNAAISAMRARLEPLLDSTAFQLEPLFEAEAGDGSSFFVLAFPGVERTLPPDILYQLAAVLREELALVSCEPDAGDGGFADPDVRFGATSEAVVVDAFCMATGQPPVDRMWALRNIRATDAWSIVPSMGKDIRIAQLDTGITAHKELVPSVVDRASALNLLEGGNDATDLLRPGTANPGHGTATGSAAVSTRAGSVSGSAPGATLIPIRCIEDVKVFDASPIVKGIEHAIRAEAHVITMSLGGLGSRALERIIRRAVERNIIIVAAAGNCVGLVVWPAAYPDVIAVGGSGPSDGIWKGTSHGSKVEFSAPAEFVWVADRRTAADPLDQLHPGQGTSFATALTAGAAALWLARFGRDAVVVEAGRRGVHVQALFRAAVRQTARRPSGWRSDRNGSGILDCKALVDLPLAQIALPTLQTQNPFEAALEAVLGPGTFDDNFDWAAHGAEVSGMLLADARAGRGQPSVLGEAKAYRLPSPPLTAASKSASDDRMARLVERGSMRPAGMLTRAGLGEQRNAGLIVQVGQIVGRGMGVESTVDLDVDAGRDLLHKEESHEILASIERRLMGLADPTLSDLAGPLASALDNLREHGTGAQLSEIQTVSLEALVELHGRPALPVTLEQRGDRLVQTIDGNHPSLGDFQGRVNIRLPEIEDRCLGSVGRIDADGHHVGTGFVIAPGLVLTNRHVLQRIASPLPTASDPARWMMVRNGSIDFSPKGNDPLSRFIIRDVAFAGSEPIVEDAIDYDKLDLALLKVDLKNPSGGALPAPITTDLVAGLSGMSLFIVGYPAAPARLPVDSAGRVRQDVVEALRRYYGVQYGEKFFSPGMVKSSSDRWWFDHDATTLGGNSGSLAASLANGKAIGLHFAGDWLKANQAHGLAAVLQREEKLRNAIAAI